MHSLEPFGQLSDHQAYTSQIHHQIHTPAASQLVCAAPLLASQGRHAFHQAWASMHFTHAWVIRTSLRVKSRKAFTGTAWVVAIESDKVSLALWRQEMYAWRADLSCLEFCCDWVLGHRCSRVQLYLLRHLVKSVCQGCSSRGQILCVVRGRACPRRMTVNCFRKKWPSWGTRGARFCHRDSLLQKREGLRWQRVLQVTVRLLEGREGEDKEREKLIR